MLNVYMFYIAMVITSLYDAIYGSVSLHGEDDDLFI